MHITGWAIAGLCSRVTGRRSSITIRSLPLVKADVDYAYFQKAFTLGLVDRPQRKIETLNELRTKYPQSAYNDDVLYELGRTYVLLE